MFYEYIIIFKKRNHVENFKTKGPPTLMCISPLLSVVHSDLFLNVCDK